jgi:UDP-glucose 4-epimerase
VRALVARCPDIGVRVLDNLSVGQREDLAAVASFVERPAGAISDAPNGVELVVDDVLNADACLRSCTGIDIVVHLAAHTGVLRSFADPFTDMQANVVGTLTALEAARQRGAAGFVFASSGAVLGNVEGGLDEQRLPTPISPYGASKLACEAYCGVYWRTFGLPTHVLRFSNAYGPGSHRKGSVIPMFLRRALADRPLTVFGDGSQTRDFIFIDDLTDAIQLAASSELGGEVFQIATGVETSVGEVAERVGVLCRSRLGRRVAFVREPARPSEVTRSVADIAKARRLLGFSPRIGIASGLERTFEYFAALPVRP